MNSSLSKLRPQMVVQTVRLLSSSSSAPAAKKDQSKPLAEPSKGVMLVRKLDSQKFVNNQSDDTTHLIDNIRIETEASVDVTLFNGVPREHIDKRRVRIFKQAKTAMQSATFDTQNWKLEFETRDRWENPLMGWGSSGDPLSSMVLLFSQKEDAIGFCEKNGWTYTVDEPQVAKKPKIKSYAANFAWNSRTRTPSK